MYLIEAINVLITVIFRVLFHDDNKMTRFFVDGNTEFKNHDSVIPSTKKKITIKKIRQNEISFSIEFTKFIMKKPNTPIDEIFDIHEKKQNTDNTIFSLYSKS